MTQQTDHVPDVRKKVTAVEWLLKYIERENWSLPYDIEEIAKAMEKKQIMESWKHGNLPTFLGRVLTAEQYYNETYKPDL